jgi:tRNA-dihydrouridine synthase B
MRLAAQEQSPCGTGVAISVAEIFSSYNPASFFSTHSFPHHAHRPHLLANRLFVAPMAGVTDRPFRRLCKQWGRATRSAKW